MNDPPNMFMEMDSQTGDEEDNKKSNIAKSYKYRMLWRAKNVNSKI